jgi:hypothetical protein
MQEFLLFGSLRSLLSCPGHISDTFLNFGWVQENVFKYYTEVFIYFVSLAILVSRVSLSCIISSALNRKLFHTKRQSLLFVAYVMDVDTVYSFSIVLFYFKANLYWLLQKCYHYGSIVRCWEVTDIQERNSSSRLDKWTVRSFVSFTPPRILLGWSNQGEWGRLGMWQAEQKRELHVGF